eukprot:222839-Rhodomonas_salina.1
MHAALCLHDDWSFACPGHNDHRHGSLVGGLSKTMMKAAISKVSVGHRDSRTRGTTGAHKCYSQQHTWLDVRCPGPPRCMGRKWTEKTTRSGISTTPAAAGGCLARL